MAYAGMSTEEYQRVIYNTCEDFQKRYPTFEAYLESYARHLAKKIRELGVEDRLDAKTRAKLKSLEVA